MRKGLILLLFFTVLNTSIAQAIGGRPWGPLATPYGYGFPFAAFNFLIYGNSLAADADADYLATGKQGYTAQLTRALTAAGVTFSITNNGIGGADVQGGPATGCNQNGLADCDLTRQVPTKVDAAWVAGRNNIMVWQEWTNGLIQDLRGDFVGSGVPAFDPTAAATTEISKMKTLFDTAANNWTVLLIDPPPCTAIEAPDGGSYNTGNGFQADYESARQIAITLINADPTFGGRVKWVYHVESDNRIGLQASSADNDFYNAPTTGSDRNTHWRYKAYALAVTAIMDFLHSFDPVKFPVTFESTNPWPNGSFPMSSSLFALDASGNPGSNGVKTKTLVPYTIPSSKWGNFVQATAANQPTYDATGFGGLPAETLVTADDMLLGNSITVTRGTVIFVGKATAFGIVLQLFTSGQLDRRFYAGHNASGLDVELYEFNTSLGGHHGCLLSGGNNVLGSGNHVIIYTFAGTCLGNHIYIDGVDQVLTVVNDGSPYNENQPATARTVTPRLGVLGATTGSLGALSYSSIVYTAADVARVDAYWCSKRGVAC